MGKFHPSQAAELLADRDLYWQRMSVSLAVSDTKLKRRRCDLSPICAVSRITNYQGSTPLFNRPDTNGFLSTYFLFCLASSVKETNYWMINRRFYFFFFFPALSGADSPLVMLTQPLQFVEEGKQVRFFSLRDSSLSG